MWYVYVLESDDRLWHYYGYTADLKRRYAEHLAGTVDSTKHHKPLSLRYYEAYDDKSLAQAREKTLKRSRSASKALLTRINNS